MFIASLNLCNCFCFRSLHHPNIIALMGYAVDEEHLYLFTNYVHCGDLHQLLYKEAQFSNYIKHVHIYNTLTSIDIQTLSDNP